MIPASEYIEPKPVAGALPARFEAKCVPEPTTGCWLWLGACDQRGYGNFWDGQRTQKAHRFAWTVLRGPIPPRLYLCHRCDVRCCVNPGHLFLGTQTDNMKDCSSKGRTAIGARHKGRRKLTEPRVRQIRSDSRSIAAIASAHDISERAVYDVRNGTSWRYLA